MRGDVSGAVAQVVSIPDQAQVRIVYLSQDKFEVGEVLTFQESAVQNVLQGIVEGNYLNVTSKYDT